MSRETLPGNHEFTHYELNLTPNLDKFTFLGSVFITFRVLNDTNELVLNAHELEIQKADAAFNNTANKPTSIDFDKELQRVTFSFVNEMKAGTEGFIIVYFTGVLNDQMAQVREKVP